MLNPILATVMTLDLIQFLIQVAPTVSFLLLILSSTLIGYFRGLRKSVIMFIHSLILGIIFICLYLFLSNTETADAMFLNVTNFFIGKNGFQEFLGVSSSCSTLKECLVEYIPKMLPLDEAIKIIVEDNGAYLAVLVNLGYHIIFGFVCYLLYKLFFGILYIIYLCFYSDRKRIKKQTQEFMDNEADASFRKRRLGGSIIGLSRGLISGLICISLFGGLFYAACGGKGQGTLQDYDFEDEYVNYYYSAYKELNRYGEYGIFAVLNAVDNKDEVPYYLYICDLVYQGKFTSVDEDGNSTTYKILLTNELGTTTQFATEVANLFMKYGGEDIRNIVLGREEDKTTMEVLYGLFTNYDFQVEFSECLSSLKSLDYINNLALSLVDSICANIDNFDWGLDEKTVDLMKLVFRKGYLSSSIPQEQALISNNRKDILPYLTTKDLLEEQDTQTILSLVYTLIENQNSDINSTIHRFISYIKRLSLFNDSSKSAQLNPLLARVYSYLENTYLEDENLLLITPSTEEGESLNAIASKKDYTIEKLSANDDVDYIEMLKDTSIDWLGEISTFVDTASEIMTIYNSVYDAEKQPLDMVLSIFDEKSSYYAYNIKAYDRITDNLANSKVLGKVLSTKAIMGVITNALKGISSSYSEPENINFTNTYDDSLNVKEYGELYYFLKGMKLLGENSDIIDKLMNSEEFNQTTLIDVTKKLRDKKDDSNNSILDYVTKSKIIESVISSFLIDSSNNNSIPVYFAEQCLVSSSTGDKLNILDANELYQILYYIPDLLTEYDLSSLDIKKMNSLINSTYMKEMINNKIMQGTVGQNIINLVLNGSLNDLVLPSKLKSINGWVDDTNQKGETKKLYNALILSKIDISNVNFETQQQVVDIFTPLSDKEMEELLSSEIIRYTISKSISNVKLENIELIVPNSSKTILENEDISYVITSKELTAFIRCLEKLNVTDNQSKTFQNIVQNKDIYTNSDIMSATMVYYMFTNNNDVKDNLYIPDSLKIFDSKSTTEEYFSTCGWKQELPRFLLAADELFEVSLGSEIDLKKVNDKFDDIIKEYANPSYNNINRRKIDVYLDSNVVMTTFSHSIDDSLFTPEDAAIINSMKNKDGYYTKKDIECLFSFMNELSLTTTLMNQDDFFKTLNVKNNPQLTYDINESRLVRYSLTCQIYNSIYCANPLLRDHPDAYENGVLKAKEIITLFDVLDSSSISEYSSKISSKINIDEILSLINDGSGKCSSYLIASTISSKLITLQGLVIPRSACLIDSKSALILDNVWNKSFPGNPIIKIEELAYLIISLQKMGIEEIKFNDSSFNIVNILNLNDLTPQLLQASTILTGTMVKNLVIKEGSSANEYGLFVSATNGFSTTDVNGNPIIMINKEEAYYLLSAYQILNVDNNLGLEMQISLDTLLELEENDSLEIVLSSSIYQIEISNFLSNVLQSRGIDSSPYKESMEVYSIKTIAKTTHNIMSNENIINVLNYLR